MHYDTIREIVGRGYDGVDIRHIDEQPNNNYIFIRYDVYYMPFDQDGSGCLYTYEGFFPLATFEQDFEWYNVQYGTEEICLRGLKDSREKLERLNYIKVCKENGIDKSLSCWSIETLDKEIKKLIERIKDYDAKWLNTRKDIIEHLKKDKATNVFWYNVNYT